MLGSTLGDKYVYGKLAGTASLVSVVGSRIGNATNGIPEAWETPFAMFQFIDDVELGGIGGPVTSQAMRYQVEVVWEPSVNGTTDALITAAHAMDASLDFASSTVLGYEVSSERINELARRQSRDGERLFRHLGADYRVFVGLS
jgi:hypothetical protein